MFKKKEKPIVKHYHVELFDADILLVHCDYKDFLKTVKKWINKDNFEQLERLYNTTDLDDFTIEARQFPFIGGGSIIWSNKNAKVSTLVHEITHVVFYLCNNRGIRYCSDSEEIYAYLMGSIFKNLLK
jgi:hypothetical protein